MNDPGNSPVILARDGKLAARIALPSGASAAEEYAAEELRTHLIAMSGARRAAWRRFSDGAPVIFVNDRDAAESAGIDATALATGDEAFHLETRGGNVYLLGGGPRGVLYGVYDLLETLGCRWFTPEVAHIPVRKRVELPPLRKTDSPAFEFRDMFIWEAGDPAWWVRNRMNGSYSGVPDYMGGQITYGLFCHTFETLVPPAEFAATHPEYFSMIEGRRRTNMTQLCLTNPDVIRLVTRRVLEKMRANPKATIFSVSQNDWGNYCQCPKCAAITEAEGSLSGPLLRFVNAVAAETLKVFPDKLIDTLAYIDTLQPPRLTKPHPSVRVRLCPIRCCQGHEFGTCDHPNSKAFIPVLEKWAELTGQLYLFHYCTNFRHYLLPMPNFDELQANVNLYRRLGVSGVFMLGMREDGGGAESSALRAYVISRLLWNPDRPVWPIVDEFLSAYYGPAASGVRKYLDVFHGRVRRDRDLHPSLYDLPTHPLFEAETLAAADEALAAGEKLARRDQRDRVKMLRNGLTYARTYRAGEGFRREGDVYRGQATEEDLRDYDRTIRNVKRAGVECITEWTTIDYAARESRNRLMRHKVLWLRDGEHSIAVAPTLGGRLFEWNAFGRQWLAPPDLQDPYRACPSQEGYEELVYLNPFVFMGYTEHYRYRRRGGFLELTGEAIAPSAELHGARLRLKRKYSLSAGRLQIDSELLNPYDKPMSLYSWATFLHLRVPAGGRTSFRTREGEKIIDWRDLPDVWDNRLVFEGPRMPAGFWRHEPPGFVVTHSWAGEELARASIARREQDGVITLDLWTDTLTLEPGRRIHISQQCRIERK